MKKLLIMLLLLSCLLGLLGCASESQSIGIIGGADGPTAVFVSSNISWFRLVFAIVLIVGIIVFFIFKRKR